MGTDTVRYGIIGTGMMGIEHIANLQAIDGTAVTAISDPDANQRKLGAEFAGGVPGFESHQDLLGSGLCDAVVIVAPNFRHHEIILDSIAAEVHVLTEKPMCVSSAECRDVIAAAEGSNRVNWVGLEYRYMPPVAALLTHLPAAGEVKMISIKEHRFPFLEKVGDWNRFSAKTGGTLVEKCCHFFDLMNVIAESRPVRVMASGGQDINHLDEVYDGETSDIMDNAFVIVEYANGVRGSLDLCMFAEGAPYEQQISVTGAGGQVEAFVPPGMSDQPGIVQVNSRSGGVIKRAELGDSHIPHVGMHHGASYLEHVDFLDSIRSGSPAKVTYEDGLWSVIVGEAAHRSIDERRAVEIAELL